MKLDRLKEVVNVALEDLYKNDSFLITHDVNERSISSKLAGYISEKLSGSDWDVDCEYNRLGKEKVRNHWRSKTLDLLIQGNLTDDTEAKTVYPDINVHHRGREGSKHNLLVIEIKKNKKTDNFDFKKLDEYGQQLGYQFGCYINIKLTDAELIWWQSGMRM